MVAKFYKDLSSVGRINLSPVCSDGLNIALPTALASVDPSLRGDHGNNNRLTAFERNRA